MSHGFDLERLYRASPVWIQNCLATFEGWRLAHRRFSDAYYEIEKEVFARRSLRGSDLRSYQGRRLETHLQKARSSAFWRHRFARFGVRPSSSDPFAEIAKLPILSKSEVNENADAIRIENVGTVPVHTSGTTGSGLSFCETRNAEHERWATWWRYRSQFGLHRDVWSAHFGGRSVVPLSQERPPFWRKNIAGRQLLMSAYHLTERTAGDYWEALRKNRIEWLHGYPSFISLLAGYAEAKSLLPLSSVRWVTTGAENLLAWQQRQIESMFGVRIHQHYGQAESVANISEDVSGGMVIDEDFSFVELVAAERDDGRRIVGTNWTNAAFPLFRYDTGDLARLPQSRQSADGWRLVQDIDGRKEDFVILRTGARVGRLDHIFKDLVNIREAQIWQPTADRVVFRIVKGPRFDVSGEERKLLAEARIRLGDSLHIDVEYVGAIPRTKRGKLRLVVSDLAAGALIPDDLSRVEE